MFETNSKVSHKILGNGTVMTPVPGQDAYFVIFSDGQPHIVPSNELEKISDINDAIRNAINTDSDKVLARIQAALIKTINDKWGVFNRSAIDLLPHQLWVCNQVLKEWPVRYLVADDVGLGKTIEAGLIIWGLIESRKIQRILILTPAPLTYQWQERMSTQFDLNFNVYASANDQDLNYWKSNNMVIVSAPTLQLKHNEKQINRQNKLFEAKPWDLVIVDEAHHMNAESNQGSTLQYQLFKNLQEAGKVESTVFFTGTPHRGFDYGFWMLMKLVAPHEFDPKLKPSEQYAKLGKYFIRNNKANTVNMAGEHLFKPIVQHPCTFSYTEEEADFYAKMTEFISSGKAYAQTLSAKEINQVQLVLIALQKLASSSICAVKGALITRKNNLLNVTTKADSDETAASDWFDAMNSDDDETPVKTKDLTFLLMEDEIKNLDELISLADKVSHESRIDKILEIVEHDFKDENVLFFTEYKKTQSLLMSELMKKYGENCVTFINGDGCLPEVLLPNGKMRRFDKDRKEAANEFNEGKVRFLISTEAAGEGIDLQKSCHVLIHADLPWNPMRLHQRVGRLNRYGQTHSVDVVTLRNPETVEAMLWIKLEQKINNIQQAFSAGMDDPEDMMNLVLGMQSSEYFTKVFSDGTVHKKQGFDTWFDSETQSFGNIDAINTVKSLVGHAAKFNLAGLKEVPKVDLPDLIPFFRRSLKLKGRSLMKGENDSWEFLTPDEWKRDFGAQKMYEGLIFRRKLNPGEQPQSICGCGFKIFDRFMDCAGKISDSACTVSGTTSYFIYKVYDMKSDNNTRINNDLIVISYDSKSGEIKQLELDEAFKQINNLGSGKTNDRYITSVPQKAEEIVKNKLASYGYALPASEIQIVLCGTDK